MRMSVKLDKRGACSRNRDVPPCLRVVERTRSTGALFHTVMPISTLSDPTVCLSLPIQVEVKKHILKAALKKGVADGVLVQNKNSYKLSAEAKKPKPKAKKAVKKAAPKKKASAIERSC